jgi:SAM-dependent methyltransferase
METTTPPAYDTIGTGYTLGRRTEPRIASRLEAALGEARTVLNVGAGTGSYEPTDRWVLAVEPSRVMRSQRRRGAAPALAGAAEHLPFDDDAFDAGMAVLTVHHWQDPRAGLAELRRVVRGPVVLLTIDPATFGSGWLVEEYVPEVGRVDVEAFPTLDELASWLGGSCRVEEVPVPADCVDGFFEAFWARPEAYLQAEVRQAQSAWHRVGPEVEARAVERLRADLESGAWDERHGHLRTRSEIDAGYRLVVGTPE